MIDGETKQKLLQEIEKVGNVYSSCLKIGVNKATYYRWKKEDKEFSKLAGKAEKLGRENMCDIAEHALMQNVKERKMEAIKYVLGHNSKRYQPKDRIVTIKHDSKTESLKKKESTAREVRRAYYDGVTNTYKSFIEDIRQRRIKGEPEAEDNIESLYKGGEEFMDNQEPTKYSEDSWDDVIPPGT
jgi:hypothetical protein